jgi:hypothetical protein
VQKKLPHAIPGPLPSELYADASHPLREGYAQLAREVVGALPGTR